MTKSSRSAFVVEPFRTSRVDRRWKLALALMALASATPGARADSLYQLLRYDEDYRYLRDPAATTEPLDQWKYISFGDNSWLSLGGESRTRYEYFQHSLWGQGPQDSDGYWLQRAMLHADFHASENVRVFAQLKSGLEGGRDGGPRSADEDRLDLNQAFVDLATRPSAETKLTLRAGRQEIGFGSSRIISYREGPNVRQSFDGVRAIAQRGPWRLDAFWVSPAKTVAGSFDDSTDSAQKLWGAYLVFPLGRETGVHLDCYYLGYENEHAHFDQGSGRELRHSIGARLWGRRGAWDFNYEGLYQFGTFAGGRIAAWTFASDNGFTFAALSGKPRLGLKADVASGDRDPHDADLQTFNALFPSGGYFNDSAIIGPANFVDLHPSIDFHATATLTLSLDCDFYWRESRNDGIYGPSLNLIRSGRNSDARVIGHQPSVRGEWRAGRHWTFVATAAYFVAGEFLRESGPGESTAYFTSWATYLF